MFEGELSGCRKLRYEEENSWPLEKGRRPRRRMRKSTKDVYVKIENFTEGDIFGEDAFMASESTRRYEVVVTSANATILIASRKISRQYFTRDQQQQIEEERKSLIDEDLSVRTHYEKCNSRLDKFNDLRLDALGPQYKKRLEASRKAAIAAKARQAKAEARMFAVKAKKDKAKKDKARQDNLAAGSPVLRQRRGGGVEARGGPRAMRSRSMSRVGMFEPGGGNDKGLGLPQVRAPTRSVLSHTHTHITTHTLPFFLPSRCAAARSTA